MFLSNRCIFKSVVFAFMAQPPHTQGARRSFGGGEGSRFSPAGSVRGGSDSPPDCLIHFRPVRLPPHKKPPHTQGARRSFGGGEGSRTPVRRWVDRTFSGCRRLLEFPAVRHQSANAAPRYLFVCLASSKEKGKRTFITQFDARFCAVILAEGTGGINGRGTAVRLPMLLVC